MEAMLLDMLVRLYRTLFQTFLNAAHTLAACCVLLFLILSQSSLLLLNVSVYTIVAFITFLICIMMCICFQL